MDKQELIQAWMADRFRVLSDEKIEQIVSPPNMIGQSINLAHELAQAQRNQTLEDVIAWGEEECLNETHPAKKVYGHTLKRKCRQCWSELKATLKEMQG